MKNFIVFSYQFSPGGRAGDFHMLRYFEFEVKSYDFTLGRLANESLRPVQDPGEKKPPPNGRSEINGFQWRL